MNRTRVSGTVLSLIAAFLSPEIAIANQAPPGPAQSISHLLVLASPFRGGRSAVHQDPLESRIVNGAWTTPHAGEELILPDGTKQVWKEIAAKPDGTFEDATLEGGYADAVIEAKAPTVYLLVASGHSLVYINGELRTGDPYETGWVTTPVHLNAGHNELLFLCGRGRLHARLIAPRSEAQFDPADLTLPDLVRGTIGKESRTVRGALTHQGAVPVLNTTDRPITGLLLQAILGQGHMVQTALPPLLPLARRKVAFAIPLSGLPPGDKAPLHLRLVRQGPSGLRELDRAELSLRVRNAGQTFMQTFVSDIDGSVQYFAVNPATPRHPHDPLPALVLSLHGASVQAIGQADAYETKSWVTLVAPTNRRPYGFDWEEWGRMDALEVLALAQKNLDIDPSRTYLAGHSMGGHGTWQMGVTFPDRFAAIGPSAGWISFSSYAGGPKGAAASPIEAMLRRASASSDTLAMGRNLAQEGVYILHGDADDNVPVTEARAMRDFLKSFHHDWDYHEQPGAGHWWDASPEPGADCVDWAPMFDFFTRHALPPPASVRQVDFVTMNPGVSSHDFWATIEAQQHALLPSEIHLRCDPGLRRFTGTTANVERLSLELMSLTPNAPLAVELDGQKIEGIAWPQGGVIRLTRSGTRWEKMGVSRSGLKGPERNGPFKEAFNHRMLFIYGTGGTNEENHWALTKARLDAETFWYRGNGSIDVIPDTQFDAGRERDRGIVIYGNADTNRAWSPLLGDSPVQVRRSGVQVGTKRIEGTDLACLFVRPRPGSDKACVAAVSGTGMPGLRLTERIPIFLSGAGFPDCTVLSTASLTRGAEGVRAAGFFGSDWSVEQGDWVW